MTTPGFKWQARFRHFFNSVPSDDRTVHYVFDATGNKGKSKFARKMCADDNWMYAPVNDQKSCASLWEGQKGVIFDTARSRGEPNYEIIEELKNGVMVQTKYEVQYKAYDAPHLLIFSNVAPTIRKLSVDRWNIITDLGDHMTLRDFFPPHQFPATHWLQDPFDRPARPPGAAAIPLLMFPNTEPGRVPPRPRQRPRLAYYAEWHPAVIGNVYAVPSDAEDDYVEEDPMDQDPAGDMMDFDECRDDELMGSPTFL